MWKNKRVREEEKTQKIYSGSLIDTSTPFPPPRRNSLYKESLLQSNLNPKVL